mmetsp:Transcript_3956/g.9699  ORF Transcript_3956/g.9699 Transcript_3956/m.9699 type:complete len:120 (+) Transcript_3956:2835-3194(+)
MRRLKVIWNLCQSQVLVKMQLLNRDDSVSVSVSVVCVCGFANLYPLYMKSLYPSILGIFSLSSLSLSLDQHERFCVSVLLHSLSIYSFCSSLVCSQLIVKLFSILHDAVVAQMINRRST